MLQKCPEADVTPLCYTNENHGWENRPFTTIWPEKQHQKFKTIERTIKKKPKRVRTAFSTNQIQALEQCFSSNKYIDSDRRRELAKNLKIGEKCVKVWFQNRRMKEKRESSESSSESSSETVVETATSMPSQPEPVPNPTPYIYYDHYYQFPYYYPYAADNVRNEVPPMHIASENVPFYDSNLYPTQYYPSAEQNISEVPSYWPSDNNDLCYF